MPSNCVKCRIQRIPGLKLHQFPKNNTLRMKWLEALNLLDKNYTCSSSICSKHFRPEDFCYRSITSEYMGSPKILKADAVPSLFIEAKDTEKLVLENEKKEDLSSGNDETSQNVMPDDEPADTDLTETLKDAQMKFLEKRIADAEEKVKELEGLFEKRKQPETSIGYDREAFLKVHIDILEKRVANAEGKLKDLQTHCKNLCDIINSQKVTISYLRSKIIASEEESAM